MNLGIVRFVLAVVFSIAGVSMVHADCAKLSRRSRNSTLTIWRVATASGTRASCGIADRLARPPRILPWEATPRPAQGACGCNRHEHDARWAMEIGGGGDEIPGRDFSIEGRNAS
jgi:hypothetical protein